MSSERWEKLKHIQGLCLDGSYRALAHCCRSAPYGKIVTVSEPLPLESARHALELADETAKDARFVYPVRDYVRADWLLGAAHRVANVHDEAERHLHEALERCRRINMVDHEADILIDLARAEHTVQPTRLLGWPRKRWSSPNGANTSSRRRRAPGTGETRPRTKGQNDRSASAAEARRLATCDGPPDYTYKVAYDESAALLAQL